MPKRILCVDDEPDVRKVLSAALRFTLKADVTTVASAREAFEFLETNEPPDLLVLDGSMPEIDGYEACRRLRADPRFARLPIVFLSARAQRHEQERALAAGANACLTKPFDPMSIGDQVREAWQRAVRE